MATKRFSALLGVGLVILWFVAMGNPTATSWLAWLDGLVAIGAFTLAAFSPAYSGRNVQVGGPLLLSASLFVLWVIGLATQATPWLCWWTFAFGCAFLGLGISFHLKTKQLPTERMNSTKEREKERQRWSA